MGAERWPTRKKPITPGRRKDGKAYKDGNTRADGGYTVGRNRPLEQSRFQTDDGRPRGKRGPGRKNLLTEWREELDSKITLSEGGKAKKVTKRRALIKAQIDRGIKKSDRASEISLRFAELSEKRAPGLQADDLEIIEQWLGGIQQTGDTDDFDAPPASGDSDDSNDAGGENDGG